MLRPTAVRTGLGRLGSEAEVKGPSSVPVLLWVCCCFLFCLVTLRRPLIPVGVALVMWMIVPQVLEHHIVRGNVAGLHLHPAAWLSLVLFTCFLASGRLEFSGSAGADPSRRLSIVGTAIGLALAVLLLNYVVQGRHGITLVLDLITAPLVWFTCAWSAVSRDSARGITLAKIVVFGGAINAVAALYQRIEGHSIVFSSDFATDSTYVDSAHRVYGLTAAPVTLAMMMACAIPLLAAMRNKTLSLFLGAAFVAVTVLTAGRVGAAFAVIGFIYLAAFTRGASGTRLVRALVAVLAIGLVAYSQLSAEIQNRIAGDNNSSNLKAQALSYFLHHVDGILLTGHGAGAGVALKLGVLNSSLEDGYAMYAFDYGLVLALAFLAFQVFLLVRERKVIRFSAPAVSGLFGIVASFTFSSIAVAPACGVLIWAALASAHGAPSWDAIRRERYHKADDGAVTVRPESPLETEAGRERVV